MNMLCTIDTDVYKQRCFTYTGNSDHLLWEEYGVKLQFFPCTSDVHIEGTVSVLSIVDDHYKFPEGTELVSAVYDIVTNRPFPVPVIVEIQHCIPLQDENEASHLGMSFVIANSQEGPPYIFRELCGGEFSPASPYGKIQLLHFCKLAQIIKWRLGRPIPFFASLYYPQNDKAKFVVTQNLAAHITVSPNVLYILHALYVKYRLSIIIATLSYMCRLSGMPTDVH